MQAIMAVIINTLRPMRSARYAERIEPTNSKVHFCYRQFTDSINRLLSLPATSAVAITIVDTYGLNRLVSLCEKINVE